MAMSYVALNMHDRAQAELQKLMKEAPSNALYPYWLGRINYDRQLFEAAQPYFDTAVALDPNFMRAHDNRGLCLEALGRIEDALAAYQKAAELNRRGIASPWPPHNLGRLLRKLGKLDNAGAVLREALQYDPNFSKARYELGVLLEKNGKLPEALTQLERAASLDPEYPAPFYAIGRIAQKRGDRERAAKAFAKFTELNRKRRGTDTPEAQGLSQEASERQQP
jgi:tetratricopeptide (TPR) repeat protein